MRRRGTSNVIHFRATFSKNAARCTQFKHKRLSNSRSEGAIILCTYQGLATSDMNIIQSLAALLAALQYIQVVHPIMICSGLSRDDHRNFCRIILKLELNTPGHIL